MIEKQSLLRMLATIVFVVSFLVYGIVGKTLETENRVKLQCHIKKYDLDSDSLVTKEEFLTVTQGFKKMNPNVLFKRLDKNGDQTLETEELKDVDPSLIKTGIFNHCRRLRCVAFCDIDITW
uniref:EF-hand domain-containing protein n=1 Tax=Magallana gigas TaxID=29159 RepID=A0A8W8N116_MAGGI|nr:uncharacterized protein LOC105333399 [Crassostrea gigas]